jgi:hypothetical protein
MRARHGLVASIRTSRFSSRAGASLSATTLSICPPERPIVGEPHAELDGRHNGGRRHGTERAIGHSRHINHQGNAAARPDVGWRAPAPHFADRFDLDESFRNESRFSQTSTTICGQRTLWREEVVRKSSSGTAFKGSIP